MTPTTPRGRRVIEDIAPKGVCSLQETERPIRHLSTQEASQTVQTCLQKYKSVNESYHLHLKQSYHAGTAHSQPFKKNLPRPSTNGLPRSLLLSFYRQHIPHLLCVYVCVCVCVCVIGVDISGICVSLFRRGRMNNSVWTHTNMCARHQWHGEEVSAAVSLYDSSELTAGWLTDVTSSISCFSKCPKQTSVYVKAKKPSSGCAHDSCHRSASHRSTDTGSRAAESCSTLWNKALEKSERQLIVHMV